MRAVVQHGPGGAEVLSLGTRPMPSLAAGQALIKVRYAGVNRHDCNQRNRGTPPPGATDILGLEVSGVVEAVGDAGDEHWLGREVCSLINGGGYAEYAVADVELLLPRPEALSMQETAALPEGLFTGWFNLVTLGETKPGDWVLIQGGASGVGTLSIQIAAALGAKVIATAGTDEKCALCLSLGATATINYRSEDYVARVADITRGHGADVIFDMAGPMYAARNLEAIARDGRIIQISNVGAKDYCVPFQLITQKRARITGSLMRGLEQERKIAVARALGERIWPLLGTTIKPVIDSVHGLPDVVAAHARMESGAHAGKILLSVPS